MASKSKNRRRVFRASCILAALIIAGSSFAWFASKDEVTNRLTASSDYGVSIVESFVPPKNWVPGQEINKDVYSVNTGNIAAFVKENVKGVLNYTYETIVDDFASANNPVELSESTVLAIDGATTNEAGGFLAWTSATVTTTTYDIGGAKGLNADAFEEGEFKAALGGAEKTFAYKYNDGTNDYYAENLNDSATFYKITTGTPNTYSTEDDAGNLSLKKNTTTAPVVTSDSINSRREDPNHTDTGVVDDRWTPPASGVYIFRRSVTNAKSDNPATADVDESQAATYTYAGYYYDKENDKYYKIVIGNDDPKATRDTNGNLSFDIDAESGSLGISSDLIDPVTGAIDPSANLRIRYVDLNKVENAVPTFKYVSKADSDVENPTGTKHPYLLATYYDPSETDPTVTGAINDKKAEYEAAVADLATKEEEFDKASKKVAKSEAAYQDALGEYNSAKSRYDQTKADYDYANALATAQNALIDAADQRATAEHAKNQAATALQQAADKLNDTAGTLLTNNTWLPNTNGGDITALKSDTLIPAATRTAIKNYNDTYGGLSNVLDNIDLFDAKYGEIKEYAYTVYQKLNYLSTISEAALPDSYGAYATSKQVQDAYDELEAAYNNLSTAIDRYNDLYTQIQTAAASETNLTGLNFNAADAITTFKTTTFAALNLGTATTGLKHDVDDYVAKYNAYDTQVTTTIPAAEAAWEAAVDAYNTAVSTAKDNYDTAINKDQPMPNYFVNDTTLNNGGKLYDHGKDLVTYTAATDDKKGYSASNKTDGDPTLDTTPAYPSFTFFTAKDDFDTTDGGQASYAVTGARNVKQSAGAEAAFDQIAQNSSQNTSVTVSTADKLGVPTSGTTPATANSLADKVEKLKAKLDTDTDATGTTDGGYEGIYNDDLADYNTKKAAYEAAKLAADNAQAAYDGATSSLRSTIKIKVVLDENAEDYWTIDPADLPTSTDVDFYYNYVLEAGETSHKLIDYVVLDDSVTSTDYKNLTFDLNVGLDSVQVTYDADQRNYTPEAVNAADETFRLDVTDPEIIPNDTTKLTWGTT